MSIQVTHVPGRKAGRVMLYALSTCVWCKKTKRLLGELGVEYDYVDVDLLEGSDKEQAEQEVGHWNPRRNYPTIVIDEQSCVTGFNENKIREALGG